MSDLSKLKKTDLIEIIKAQRSELKEYSGLLEKSRENADKPFTAVSVIKIDGDFCAVTIGFNESDIVETIKYDAHRPHMADHSARKMLEKTIQKNQELNHK